MYIAQWPLVWALHFPSNPPLHKIIKKFANLFLVFQTEYMYVLEYVFFPICRSENFMLCQCKYYILRDLQEDRRKAVYVLNRK